MRAASIFLFALVAVLCAGDVHSAAAKDLWKVLGEDGAAVLVAPGGNIAYIAPTGSLLKVSNPESADPFVQVDFPWPGFVQRNESILAPVTFASPDAGGDRFSKLLPHNFSHSRWHIASLANSGHWTEQAPVGNGFLGAFVGGPLRQTVLPVSVTDFFSYGTNQLSFEAKPISVDKKAFSEARSHFMNTGQFQERVLRQKDGTGTFQGMADLVLLTSSSPFKLLSEQPSEPPRNPSGKKIPFRGGGAAGRWAVLQQARSLLNGAPPASSPNEKIWSSIGLDMAAGVAYDQHLVAAAGKGNSDEVDELVYREYFADRQHNALITRMVCHSKKNSGCLNAFLSLARGLDNPRNMASVRTKVRQLELSSSQLDAIARSLYSRTDKSAGQPRLQVDAYGYEMKVHSSDNLIVPESLLCLAVLCISGKGEMAGKDGIACNSAKEMQIFSSIAKQSSLGEPLSAFKQHGDGESMKQSCWDRLHAVIGKGLHKVRQAHITSHKEAMHRVDFQLLPPPSTGETAAEGDKLATTKISPLLFHTGRYLLMASTGSMGVANLQGLWADGLQSAWNGDYHLNINMQMIYWPIHSIGWSEGFEGVVAFLEKLKGPSRAAARTIFGASEYVTVNRQSRSVTFHDARPRVRGNHDVSWENPAWLATGFTDSRLVGELLGGIQWSYCVTCGAWMATHLFDHVLYLEWNDATAKKVREKVLPVLQGVALFFLEHFLATRSSERDGQEKLVHTGPTTSPENSYRIAGTLNKVLCVAMTPAIDISVLREVSHGYSTLISWLQKVYAQEASIMKELEVDAIIASRLAEEIRWFPNRGIPRIHPSKQQVMEYPDSWVSRFSPSDSSLRAANEVVDETVDPGHRHFSGVHWLYPGTLHHPVLGSAIDADVEYNNRALFSAAGKFMQHKKQGGGGHTSWSASWEASLWARLGEAEHAYRALQRVQTRYMTSNLLSIHPPLEDMHRPGCITCYKERPFRNNMGLQRQLKPAMENTAVNMLSRRREFETDETAKFQLDGNSGYTAAVVEMLVQSFTPNTLHLLPALPSEWKAGGQVRGVRGRGHVRVDVDWVDGRLLAVEVHFQSPHPYWTQSAAHHRNVLKMSRQTSATGDKGEEEKAIPLAIWAPNRLSVDMRRTNQSCLAEELAVGAVPESTVTAVVTIVRLSAIESTGCTLRLTQAVE